MSHNLVLFDLKLAGFATVPFKASICKLSFVDWAESFAFCVLDYGYIVY